MLRRRQTSVLYIVCTLYNVTQCTWTVHSLQCIRFDTLAARAAGGNCITYSSFCIEPSMAAGLLLLATLWLPLLVPVSSASPKSFNPVTIAHSVESHHSVHRPIDKSQVCVCGGVFVWCPSVVACASGRGFLGRKGKVTNHTEGENEHEQLIIII